MENEYATFKEDKPKIYDFNSMVIGTFIGGPLVIGYMLAENYMRCDGLAGQWSVLVFKDK